MFTILFVLKNHLNMFINLNSSPTFQRVCVHYQHELWQLQVHCVFYNLTMQKKTHRHTAAKVYRFAKHISSLLVVHHHHLLPANFLNLLLFASSFPSSFFTFFLIFLSASSLLSRTHYPLASLFGENVSLSIKRVRQQV